MRFAYDTSYADARRLLRFPAGRIAYALLLAALLAAPFVLPKFFIGEGAALFISAIMSLGLMLLMGYTGQVSLGHASFAAIGAYAHVWLMGQGVPFLLSLPLAAVIAGVAGIVIGLPAIRVSGLYLAMVTLAFSLIVEQVAGRWKEVTGGYGGIAVPDPVVFGFNLGGLVPFYYLCPAGSNSTNSARTRPKMKVSKPNRLASAAGSSSFTREIAVGSSDIRHAPITAPRSEPSPPITTISVSCMERSSENPSGVRYCT